MPRHSAARMNSVFRSDPPSMQAKHPRSVATVCSPCPPSRTRTHRLLGTSAYHTAFSASMQIPSGTPAPRSAHARRFDKAPSESTSRSEEHTSESSHGYISYAVFCLKKKKMQADKNVR